MGDTAGKAWLARPRALWTAPLAGEDGAPALRIVHALALDLPAPACLLRLGLRRTRGYHKCGSRQDLDRVTAFRLLVWDGTGWTVLRHETDLPDPAERVVWMDLGGVETSAVRLEVRRSAIDGWWPSWNLTAGAFALETDRFPPPAPRDERRLRVMRRAEGGARSDENGGLGTSPTQIALPPALLPPPSSLHVSLLDGALRFEAPGVAAAFALGRAAMTPLALDGDAAEAGGGPATGPNLLRRAPGRMFQGPVLAPVGAAPLAADVLRCATDGTTEPLPDGVRYRFALGPLRYTLTWTVGPGALTLHAVRESDEAVRATASTAWTLGFDATVTPPHVLGPLVTTGETGLVEAPAWLDVPRFGSLYVETTGDVLLRSDAVRPEDRTLLEVKLGELPQPEGDYLLPAGRHEGTVTFRLARPDVPLRPDAPAAVARAVAKTTLTALTYRPDTATLSNNGASMHCPICLDVWSALTTQLGPLRPGFSANETLRTSLERWLTEAPGYASGWLVVGGRPHLAEDEYLMTGAAALRGLADYLETAGTAAWVAEFHDAIGRGIARMRARDLDRDGLVESPYRTGTSGSGQWSTCWWDVLSFGWKDAFSNALLYPALRGLARALPRLGAPDLAAGLDEWADRLRAAYRPAFWNDATGWLAGWRCRQHRLHDHGFLFVTGAAVTAGLLDDADARGACERLLAELDGLDLDATLGLPGNLRDVPDADRSDILQGYPYGFYQNGGQTHSQARHFLSALYRVGLTAEADALLEKLCAGLADGRVYGGVRSGLDWRFHDGQPCGYEGLLTDQFGVVALALERWGARSPS